MAESKPAVSIARCIIFETDIPAEALQQRFLRRRTRITNLLPLREGEWVAILDTVNPIVGNQMRLQIEEFISKYQQTEDRRNRDGMP